MEGDRSAAISRMGALRNPQVSCPARAAGARPRPAAAPDNFCRRRPEPHILLFRRPAGTDPVTGKAPDDWAGHATQPAQSRSVQAH